MSELAMERPDDDTIEIRVPCIRAIQPVGDLFISVIDHKTITRITYFDVRRVIQQDRDVERYLGIQRPLNLKRVIDLQSYVRHYDASFPTSVIIAIPDDYVRYDEENRELILSNTKSGDKKPSIAIRNLARVIDGQHRIAGLTKLSAEDKFDVAVSIFVGADIADQAHLFATVNLEQTKVSKSLAYDLYELARSRSPQKTCHNIAVALDQDKESPLYRRIKRLGVATQDRVFEPITQATFVESLMRYISKDPRNDRDQLMRGLRLPKIIGKDLVSTPLRNLFVEERDLKIAEVIFNYFTAVKRRWPEAWDARGRGYVLNRTNGFRALMRAFGEIYLRLGAPGDIISSQAFERYFTSVDLSDSIFTIDYFPPGTSGEAKMYRIFTREDIPQFNFGTNR